MDKWRSVTWGEVISLEYGKALRGYSDVEGRYRVFGTNGPIGWTDEPLATGPGIILGRKGAYRGVHYSKEPFFVIDTAYYIVPKIELDMRWLYYAIIAYELGKIDDGSPIPSTTRSAVYPRELALPPLAEQRRIASILGSLDDKIEHNRRTAQALERLARAIFKAWFVDFEPVKAKAAGATSFPSMPQDVFDALPTTFVDTEIGPVPEGWGVGKLGDYCLINQSNVRKGEIDGTIEYVDISSVTEGRLDEIREVDFNEAPSRARRRVAHGDTIWSCVRPNRKSYLFIHTPPENRIVSTGFAVLSPGGFGPSYLYELTTRQEFVDYLVVNAQGSAYPAVRADTFSNASVVVPPSDLLNAFEARTLSARDLVAVQDKESRRLARLRDYILPKLMTGRRSLQEIKYH